MNYFVNHRFETQKPRVLVICPDWRGASGGVAVLYEAADILRSEGWPTFLLHPSPDGMYQHYRGKYPTAYAPELHLAGMGMASRRNRITARMRAGLGRTLGPIERRVAITSDDVLIVPEFLLDGIVSLYPEARKVIFVQNPFLYMDAVQRCYRMGLDPLKGVVGHLGVSDNCADAIDMIGSPCSLRVTVSPNLVLFPYQAQKERRIAFMPRKRPEEAAIMERLLHARGRLRDFELRSIDREGQDVVAREVGRSALFVSLLKHESLGFPAMEAMAAGCYVVGFTGHGGDEYFDETVGLPVREDDIAALVRGIEDAVARWCDQPHEVDVIRQRASQRIRGRYPAEGMRTSLLNGWSRLEPAMKSVPPVRGTLPQSYPTFS